MPEPIGRRGEAAEPSPRVSVSAGAPAAALRLGRGFFARDPSTLAQALLGCRLVRTLDDGTRLAGLIVETEAYLGAVDRAAHTYNGRRTPRNEAMYAHPGTAYVYFTYGMHHCLNVVCGAEGEPVAVLLRALCPVEGLKHMRELRSRPDRPAPEDRQLCSGPGKLCQALAVCRLLNHADLTTDGRLWIEPPTAVVRPENVGNSGRIGVGSAQDWAARLLRWFVKGDANVSKGPIVLSR